MISYLQVFWLLWCVLCLLPYDLDVAERPPLRAYRYIRLIVNLISSWTFPPIPLPKAPTLFPSDVTVVIPTIAGEGQGFIDCLESCIQCEPNAVIIVTTNNHVSRLQHLCRTISKPQIQVLGVERACKRHQMVQGLMKVGTALTVFADDDVLWPRTLLKYLLVAFEDRRVGGAGTCQRLRRDPHPSFWNILGAFYLDRRNFEISATSHIDGGISCLSGRTSAFRTPILQNKAFISGFANEAWLGRIPLSAADDDNFLTRWMVSSSWRTKIQCCKEAEVLTTLNDGPSFVYQCLRWARTNWRSNVTSMLVERHIWRYPVLAFGSLSQVAAHEFYRKQPWCAYALHLATFSPPALIMDGLLALLLFRATKEVPELNTISEMIAFAIWLVVTKVVKLVPHLYRYPMDIRFIPVAIVFGYLHGFIKIYALLTLNVTNWGGRDTVHKEFTAWRLKGAGSEVLDRFGRVVRRSQPTEK